VTNVSQNIEIIIKIMEALYQWPFLIDKAHKNKVQEVFPAISMTAQSLSYSMSHFCIKDVMTQSETKPVN